MRLLGCAAFVEGEVKVQVSCAVLRWFFWCVWRCNNRRTDSLNGLSYRQLSSRWYTVDQHKSKGFATIRHIKVIKSMQHYIDEQKPKQYKWNKSTFDFLVAWWAATKAQPLVHTAEVHVGCFVLNQSASCKTKCRMMTQNKTIYVSKCT